MSLVFAVGHLRRDPPACRSGETPLPLSLCQAIVTASGFVQPCTGVDVKVGNIRHDTLANILAGSPVLNCMRDLRVQIKGACRECDLAGSCYGCRGLAYHVTGDFLASDPLCWRNPKHL
jgi:radical SAM protein with 4Fe4S-binding SPASM domain